MFTLLDVWMCLHMYVFSLYFVCVLIVSCHNVAMSFLRNCLVVCLPVVFVLMPLNLALKICKEILSYLWHLTLFKITKGVKSSLAMNMEPHDGIVLFHSFDQLPLIY